MSGTPKLTPLAAGDANAARPLAHDARAVVRLEFDGCLSLRTWRSMDAAAKTPAGFRVGGKKLWRVRDLQRWSQWGFPNREDFEARMEMESKSG